MTLPRPPRHETRRRAELRSEMLCRARVWLPEWEAREDAGDPGVAVLDIAARLESEVTQRLDRLPEKSFRGFLSWLGVRGKPGRAARIPLAFRLANKAEPVLAEPPVQVQADAGGAPIIFETDLPLRVVPGNLVTVIGADPANDRFYGPFPGLSPWEPPTPGPAQWRQLSPAPAGSTQVQLDPPTGLAAGLELESDGKRYRVTEVKDGLVTIEPPLGTPEPRPIGAMPPGELIEGAVFNRVTSFVPFGWAERDQQRHALYVGSEAGLDIGTPALIEVTAASLPLNCNWHYWGKERPESPPGWVALDAHQIGPRCFLIKAPRKFGTASGTVEVHSGSIEPTEIGGRTSRWLRAMPAGGQPPDAAFPLRGLRLKLNCRDGLPQEIEKLVDRQLPRPTPQELKLEGIANTAPLVLDRFYPLGREPRLFDAFYLGCEEAFSKPGAEVTIEVVTGESFSGPIVSARLGAGSLVAGVGSDGRLRLATIAETEAGPGRPAFSAPLVPRDSGGQEVKLTAGLRPGIVVEAGVVHLAVAAGNDVWRWESPPRGSGISEDDDTRWRWLGAPVANVPVDDVVLTRMSDGTVVANAIAGGKLYRRAIGATEWQPVVGSLSRPATPPATGTVDVPLSDPTVVFKRLAGAVSLLNEPGVQRDIHGLAAVTEDGSLVLSRESNTKWRTLQSSRVSRAVYPLVVLNPSHNPIVAFAGELHTLNAGTENETVETRPVALDLANLAAPVRIESPLELIGRSFSFVSGRGEEDLPVVFFGRTRDGVRARLWWPLGAVVDLAGPVRPAGSEPVGAPVPHGRSFVIPEQAGALALMPAGQVTDAGNPQLRTVALIAERLARKEHLIIDFAPNANNAKLRRVERAMDREDRTGTALLIEGTAPQVSADRKIEIYRGLQDDFATDWNGNKLELSDTDDDARVGGLLYVRWASGSETQQRIVRITAIAPADGPNRIATLSQALPGQPGKLYRNVAAPQRVDGNIRSALKFNVLPELPALYDSASVEIGIDDPHRIAEALRDGQMVVLSDYVKQHVTVPARFVTAFGASVSFSPPRPRNPELSWEYWDGQSWWQIAGVTDGTGNLVSTGEISFQVPSNLRPADVVGRTNHWIRARLIGGDYGQEEVTLTTSPPDVEPQTQTVKRSTSGIRAPYVASITVRYALCTPMLPEPLLTEDGGGYRDQTAANAAANAQVPVFTPLKYALPATGAAGAAPGPADDCGCDGGEAGDAATPPPAAELANAIYLGFDSSLRGDAISLLFLVEEGPQEGLPGLVVEAFAEGGFSPLTIKDETRGLSESGLVTLSLPLPLQEARLFGRSLHWLRLKARGGQAGWQPRIRAIYLNAAFATAGETQQNEVLGSSDGSPEQSYLLARAPVVAGTLELRVREALGDEEIEKLRAGDRQSVIDEIGPWPGPWVRWRQSDTLALAGPGDRVFQLDATDGRVRFGDGKHGRVPPVGRDCVVAVRYRQGGGSAANQVPAWGAINLITPLAGVEATIAPEGAAGGSDEQGPETALRFAPANLRMQDRALTLGDIEHLGLQSSPDIAQVKALRSGAGLRVVQVMAGREKRPASAQRRELQRYLLERTPPALQVPGALRVVGPRLVEGRVEITLLVEDLSLGGSVAEAVVARTVALFDPATGGRDGLGWPLGAAPDESDLAAALEGIDGLTDLDAVAFAGGGALAADQLYVIGEDDVAVVTRVDTEVTG